ncbi:aminoacyl-tRNA hydrolase [Hoeflea prorocentri]|uniref:Peptidyl-tRNA hydrolase n=1 Tax=Hoeflea prorocentri TaxID=1922333 RepID=A0A9X3UDY9_9HYPH|nr:aminoacyl-tRNA hydrolase [Hoeflea prorocentri]MCY6379547.1 aminoacyl-tRNA hydrolase [Hoeflea prorocentri]MDA5397347.1 aminoacyl-tRNA hydrolase [Hoeflea prorocentri]
MLVIAGLGNPGPRYAKQRHNIGFMAADAIARRHSFSGWSKKFKGEISEGTIADEKILIIKPQTFMNLSGESVGEAMRFYKLSPSDLIVIYDELDLQPGKVRIKTGGGAGGHNGIKSIDAHCGKDYRRLRLGIGHPGAKERVSGHVLGDFAKADGDWVDPLLDAVADNVTMLISGDDAGFLNKISLATGNGAHPKPTGNKKTGKGKSHIRAARPSKPAAPPASGPMAGMLKKLFGNKE